MPSSNDIYHVRPFSIVIKVEKDDDVITNQAFNINQWSGENITLQRVGVNEQDNK